MPEPFKNLFNPEMITLIARHIKRVWAPFDMSGFISKATKNLDELGLKQRSSQIKYALDMFLPVRFADAAPILLKSLHPEDDVDLSGTAMDNKGIRGWAIMPMTEYVGDHGIVDFDLGMCVQKELTKRFSSEFGIRDFIIHDQDRALAVLKKWTKDDNFHVRRLVSEGSRPRLPWAMQLPQLIQNPDPLFPILEELKDDPVEYVRRSVANNLNDIAKDHPQKITQIAADWMKNATPKREKLVRHACRTLIKKGHRGAMSALGYEQAKVSLVGFDILTPKVSMGNKLSFSIELLSQSPSDQDVILDYIIHHVKANGRTSPKAFKWKTFKLKANACLTIKRNHAFKPITTRKYYAGMHRVEIQLNGDSLGSSQFELVMPEA